MEVGAAGEGIQSGKETTWDMDDLEIEICEVEQPSYLAMVEVLDLMEVCQVLVVSKDLDRKEGSMEIISPGFQGTDDCEELSVVDVIVPFSQNE